MAVTHDDVRNIAALARLAVPADRLDAIARELTGILVHMDALADADARIDASAQADATEETPGMRLATDEGPPVTLERSPSEFAPAWREGFFLVPRLATHGDAGASAEEQA